MHISINICIYLNIAKEYRIYAAQDGWAPKRMHTHTHTLSQAVLTTKSYTDTGCFDIQISHTMKLK